MMDARGRRKTLAVWFLIFAVSAVALFHYAVAVASTGAMPSKFHVSLSDENPVVTINLKILNSGNEAGTYTLLPHPDLLDYLSCSEGYWCPGKFYEVPDNMNCDSDDDDTDTIWLSDPSLPDGGKLACYGKAKLLFTKRDNQSIDLNSFIWLSEDSVHVVGDIAQVKTGIQVRVILRQEGNDEVPVSKESMWKEFDEYYLDGDNDEVETYIDNVNTGSVNTGSSSGGGGGSGGASSSSDSSGRSGLHFTEPKDVMPDGIIGAGSAEMPEKGSYDDSDEEEEAAEVTTTTVPSVPDDSMVTAATTKKRSNTEYLLAGIGLIAAIGGIGCLGKNKRKKDKRFSSLFSIMLLGFFALAGPVGVIAATDATVNVSATVVEPYCGDGVCSSAIGETFETCPQDCPSPQLPLLKAIVPSFVLILGALFVFRSIIEVVSWKDLFISMASIVIIVNLLLYAVYVIL